MDNNLFDITQPKKAIYQKILKEYRKYIEFDAAVVIWFDPLIKALIVKFSQNIKRKDLLYLKDKLISIKEAMKFITDSKIKYGIASEKFPQFDAVTDEKFVSVIPLFSKNEAIGLLLFYSAVQSTTPDKSDLVALNQLIEYTTIIIKNHIYTSLKEEIYVLTTTIFDLSQKENFDLRSSDGISSILFFLKMTFNVRNIEFFFWESDTFGKFDTAGFYQSQLTAEQIAFLRSIKDTYYDENTHIFYISLFDGKRYFGIFKVFDVINSSIFFNTFSGIRTALVSAIKNCRLYDTAYRSSMIDNVSSVYSKYYFDIRIKEEVKRADRYSLFLSVMYIEIDEFQGFRQMYDALTCNKILLNFGMFLKSNLRKVDFTARVEDAEFAVILPNTDLEGTYIAARRILSKTNNAIFDSFKLNVSIGIASFPFDGKAAAAVLEVAKQSTHLAKSKGANQIEYVGNVHLIK